MSSNICVSCNKNPINLEVPLCYSCFMTEINFLFLKKETMNHHNTNVKKCHCCGDVIESHESFCDHKCQTNYETIIAQLE